MAEVAGGVNRADSAGLGRLRAGTGRERKGQVVQNPGKLWVVFCPLDIIAALSLCRVLFRSRR